MIFELSQITGKNSIVRTFENKGGGHSENWKKGFEPKIFLWKKNFEEMKANIVHGVTESRTHDPSFSRPACCHGSIRNTLMKHDER